ncbi:MAG: hypothetical protein QNK19_01900 [Xanthomonadales bacterium]|nr:hypothetical protein [Xanthomonadales bacterium]
MTDASDCGSSISSAAAEVAGFSLHAGVATKANERVKLRKGKG